MGQEKSYGRELELQTLLRRDHTLLGAVVHGIEGHVIEIQARATDVIKGKASWRGAVTVIGMARGAVNEAIDRIGGAFSKLEIPNPEVKIVINLAPPDLPKEGTWLDLPLSVIMLQAAGYLPDLHEQVESDYILIGEIGLHGEVRRVPGVLSMAHNAKKGQALIIPKGNEKECAVIMTVPSYEGCKISCVSKLIEVIDFFRGSNKLKNALSEGVKFKPFDDSVIEIGAIKGQQPAKEAALIAAAGGHNLLLIGPPGEGKSLLASSLPSILPSLSNQEILELTKIYSACGQLQVDGEVITRRPMRTVHHTASRQAIVGGGSNVPKPGEITLAHLGVLFLDELAEFSQSSIDCLRQPMEQGRVQITRVGASLEFPSDFTLVAAMNPCPCGYFGSEKCRCSSKQIESYQKKISGPILDRIDLKVEVSPLSAEERFSEPDPALTKEFRRRVVVARKRQSKRFEGTRIPHNASIPGGKIKEYCRFSESGFSAYKDAIESHNLSTRSMDRIAKVSRTIADLYNSDEIEPIHISRATHYVAGKIAQLIF